MKDLLCYFLKDLNEVLQNRLTPEKKYKKELKEIDFDLEHGVGSGIPGIMSQSSLLVDI